MVDVILPILQRIQADIGVLKTDVGELKADVGGLKADVSGLKTDVRGIKQELAVLNGQFAAFKDMSEARFNAIEHVLLDLSARTYVLEQRDRTQ